MTNTITFLSYNTHLFAGSNPAFLSPSLKYEDERRSQEILHRSNGQFDVLAFTEVWADKMRDHFANALVDRKSYIPQPDVNIIKRELSGSPGMVLSVKGEWAYGPSFDYYGDMVGDDKLAYKGVSFGVARINGMLVGLVQTHTQATYTGKEEEDRLARDQQIEKTLFPAIEKVQQWLASSASDGPIVLLGDMNIVGETDEYKWFSEELGKRGFQDCWTQTNPGKDGYTYVPADNPLVKHWDETQTQPQRLDYIFLNPGATEARCKEMAVLHDWKVAVGGDNIDLSDHYPITATIDIP